MAGQTRALWHSQRRWAIAVGVETIISLGVVWNCYRLGGCSSALCVPTGSALQATCVLVGLKVLLAFLGGTLVVALAVRRDKKKR